MKFFLIPLIICLPLGAQNLQRIESMLTINDPKGALQELQRLLAEDPDNGALRRFEIISLARLQDITSLLKAYKSYCEPTSDNLDKELLEEVAWAIIQKAASSNIPFIRHEAHMAAFMANDAKGIPLCLAAMHDPSEQARLLALAMARNSHDEQLLTAAFEAMREDSSARVRLQAISTVGATRLTAAQETLEKILESTESTAEEKMAAIDALTNILSHIDTAIIQALCRSERAVLRQLACELVLEQFDKEQVIYIFPLMNDATFDVRLAAIQCVVALGLCPPHEIWQTLKIHKDIKTQILASWLSLVLGYEQELAVQQLTQFLSLPDQSLRLFAAGAIAHSGKGAILFSDAITAQDDPLVRLNLSIGLIWQRADVQRACQYLLQALQTQTRLSWQSVGIISFVGPSVSQHVGSYARLPESEDLFCRLQLYTMISACRTIELKEALKGFLKERTWGISGQTAFLMVQEGLLFFDELKSLLSEPSREIALQAAFLLALYAQDEDALKVLEQAYPTASRQMREYILYAVGMCRASSAIPFLVKVLNEPFESLRVIAARSLLICLYH